MKALRCAGIRTRDEKRCGVRVKQKPDSEGRVWCRHHIDQAPSSKKKPTVAAPPVKEADPCAICTDKIKPKENALLACGHDFHLECVKQLHNPICPMCRQPLKSKLLSRKDIEAMKDRGAEDADQRDREQLANFLENDQAGMGIMQLLMAHSQFNDMINTVMQAYDNMLEGLRANLQDNPDDAPNPTAMIISLVTVVTITGSVVGLQLDTGALHDILLQDIPPLFPTVNVEDIHASIHDVLGMP